MANGLRVPLSRDGSVTSSTRPGSHASSGSSIPILQPAAQVTSNSTTQYGTQTLGHATEARPSSSSQSTPQHTTSVVPHDNSLAEWRSLKIRWPYLSLNLIVAIIFISSITTLAVISNRDDGFARESRPPPVLQRKPGLRKAIWEQGIFYTAVPAFIMTIYRTMWDAAVMAFADRQPYVDLMKSGGRSPRRTILLDYKMETILSRWIAAFKNRHFVLSACMLSSLVLSFAIVPLTSFLFMMDTTPTNSTQLVSVDTYYDARLKLGKPSFGSIPNLRLALDTSAGMHMQNLRAPPNTDGTFAFPHYSPQRDTGASNLSISTTAYSLKAGCVEIPESRYTTIKRELGSSLLIDVHAMDRGCAILGTIAIRRNPWSPTIFMLSWHTSTCSEEAGSTRLSLLAARYDKSSRSVQNFTLISCNPSYFTTLGTLVQRSETGKAAQLLRFDEWNGSRTEQTWSETSILRLFLELNINTLRYLDVYDTIDGNEFAQDIYRMAGQKNPTQALNPVSLANATETLFETIYAVFASMYLFRDLVPPANSTAVYTITEKRLFIVPVVAYIILGVLGITSILNLLLFRSAREELMLKEEPFSLMSYAGSCIKVTWTQHCWLRL